jgi:diguanylate cyclase (GGDEF)-like protein/PAS domain S-box-containing protein
MLTEFIHPESRLYFEQVWANLLAGDMAPTYEYQIITRAGETKWIGQRNVLINDEVGKAIAIEGIIMDVTERKHLIEALQESENRFRLMFEKTADALLLLDPSENKFIDCNSAAAAMLGYRSLKGLLPLKPSELSPPHQPDDRDSFEKAQEMIAIALRKGSHRFEWMHCSPHRENFPVEVLLTPMQIGKQQLIMTTWRDITERKQSEEALRKSEKQLQFISDHAPVSIAHCDHEKRYKFVNTAYAEMFGLQPSDIIGKHPRDIFGKEAFAHALPYMDIALSGQSTEYDLCLPTISREVSVHYSPEHDETGGVVGFIEAVSDITERKEMEAKLDILASTDGLTGVYNRIHFNTKLENEVQRAIRFGTPLSLLMLDIDHFKKINDTYGHLAGDACLVALGKLMQGLSRSIDTCARYGGEEFVIILPQTPLQNATSFAERLRQKVETLEVKYEDQAIQYTISIGVNALSLTEGKTGEELLKTVDRLLYGAKESGRNCVISYSKTDSLIRLPS